MTLRAHGFLSITLDSDMSNLCKVLPLAKNIPRIGRTQVIDGEEWYFLNMSLWTHKGQETVVGYTAGTLYDVGTYGKIYKTKRMVLTKRPDRIYDVVTHPEEIVIKKVFPDVTTFMTDHEIQSHTSEALLHVLSWRIMQETSCPWAIPQPFEIFGERGLDAWLSMSLSMSLVEGETLHNFLKRVWKTNTKVENSKFFKEIIGQTAYILYHLQNRLHLNHRDLKVNNLLVRPVKTPFSLTIDGSVLSTTYEVTMIDFGFACVGCHDDSHTLFQAGSWFPFSDICHKKGRDLAQLIYCINTYFPLDLYLTPELFTIVKGFMVVDWHGSSVSLLGGFTKDGLPSSVKPAYHRGIYEFLRRDVVDPDCAPAKVFRLMAN